MTERVVLITGASSGMGLAAAQLFAGRGWQVYAGARRVEKIPTDPGIHAAHLDVTESDSIHEFVAAALADAGRIDILVNNAGYGEFGPLEEVPMDKARKQLETNLLGAAEMAQAVLPTMRAQHEGRIINISSIGGEMYSPLGGWYYVTKRALNVWSDTLDTEIRQFGVRSIIVEPGGTESAWSEIAMKNARANLKPASPYEKLVDATESLLGGMSSMAGATSAQLAEVFYRAATDLRPKYRYYHSLGDHLVGHIARAHQRLFKGALTVGMKYLMRDK